MPLPVLLDTDLGSDVDDALALGVLLAEPEARATPRAVARRFHDPFVVGDEPSTSRRLWTRKQALQGGAPGWEGLLARAY